MRKADITADLVSRLIADQFPQWAGLPIQPVEAGGVDNTTFRLGQAMSVRLPSADAYVEQVDKEQRWLPVLARQLPLPIPEPLAKGVPGHGFPRPWSVYRWIDGDPATAEGITDMAKFAADLADFLVALYQIDPAGGPGHRLRHLRGRGSRLRHDDRVDVPVRRGQPRLQGAASVRRGDLGSRPRLGDLEGHDRPRRSPRGRPR